MLRRFGLIDQILAARLGGEGLTIVHIAGLAPAGVRPALPGAYIF
jgi:hypothetical protein